MAQRRQRHARRNALVFLGSFLAHVLFFFFAARELMIPYRLPMPMEPAIEAELIPPEPSMSVIPPPVPIPPKPKPTPVPPTPTPTPRPQPQPQPAQAAPAQPQPAPRLVVRPTAPAKVAEHPTLMPTEKPVAVISPLTPPLAAPQPGPPQEQPHAAVAAEQPHVVTARANPKLKRNNQNPNAALAGPPSLPSIAPAGSPAPPGGGAGAPGGGGAGGLPGGSLPSGFGSGLRGSLLGCIDSGVAKLTPEEQARCNARLGADAKNAPVMDPIGATERNELDTEQQQEQAAQKYRDEMPTGSVDQTIPGQPRLGHKPGGP